MKKLIHLLIILLKISTNAYCQELNECDPQKILFAKEDINCFGDSNGKIKVLKQIKEKFAFKLVNLNEGKTVRDSTYDTIFDYLSSANYRIIIKDSLNNLCSKDITIISPNEIVFSKDNIIPTKPDRSQKNGSLNISLKGGVLPYKLFINKVDNSYIDTIEFESTANKYINNLSDGLYSIYVRDKNGCESKSTQFELGIKNNFDFEVNQVPNTCDDKEIFEVNLFNGQKPYSIKLKYNNQDVLSTTNFNLDKFAIDIKRYGFGDYKLEIEDSRKIPVTLNYKYEDINCNLIVTTETIERPNSNDLNNGKVKITVNNSKPPYKILCKNQLTNESVYDKTNTESSVVFSNLKEGSYSLLIEDGAGRKYDKSFIIKDSILDRNTALAEFKISKADFLRELNICECNYKSIVNWQKGIRITVSTLGLAGTIASAGTGTLFGGIITGIVTTGGTLSNEFASDRKVDGLRIRYLQLKSIEILYNSFSITNFDAANWDTEMLLKYLDFKAEILEIRKSFDLAVSPECKESKLKKKYNISTQSED